MFTAFYFLPSTGCEKGTKHPTGRFSRHTMSFRHEQNNWQGGHSHNARPAKGFRREVSILTT